MTRDAGVGRNIGTEQTNVATVFAGRLGRVLSSKKLPVSSGGTVGAAGRTSLQSIEETRGPEMGELGPLPST
jgi:hypothetical protein